MKSKKHLTEPVAVTVGGAASKSDKFSKQRLLIYVAIFAIIGIIALVISNALTPSNGDFEAETMTVEAL